MLRGVGAGELRWQALAWGWRHFVAGGSSKEES